MCLNFVECSWAVPLFLLVELPQFDEPIKVPANQAATRYLRVRWVAVFLWPNIQGGHVCEVGHSKLFVWMQSLREIDRAEVVL